MKRILKNREGTAEIVGTVLFLVILFFFFSNVFLWHDQVTRGMDQIVADKMNSPVKMETAVESGELVYVENRIDEYIPLGFGDTSGAYEPRFTRYVDDFLHRDIQEHPIPTERLNQLKVDYTFNTRIGARQKMALVSSLRVCVRASYDDDKDENCSIRVYDGSINRFSDTGLVIPATTTFSWFNVTLSQPSKYVDGGGHVKIEFQDASSTEGSEDEDRGMLSVDCMEVSTERVVLRVTDLGGVDAILSRLWIVDSALHVYADYAELERIDPSNVSIPAGSRRDIVFNMTISETEFNLDGSIRVWPNAKGVVVNYVPPSAGTVIFKIITKLGNTAACSYGFTSG